MKSRLALSTLTISVTLVGSGAALGQEYKTREQVRAELAEANRDGTILSGDGTLWRDLGAPHRADTTLAGKTREQVRAELAEANRDGTILSGDGTLWRDLGSLHYLAAPSFVARSNHTSGTPSMAGTDRSPDMGAGKN
jgi:hypothetical protein